MNVIEKTEVLKGIIEAQLAPLVDADYVLLDLPYYTNIGDTLIWEGTRLFLNTLPHKCLYRASVETFKPQTLSSETVILLQGGGNFGDIWRRHQDFRLSIIKSYPNNKIIILPQTAFYNDIKALEEDAAVFNAHGRLHICVRDTKSLALLKKYLSCDVRLVPDMAFCIPPDSLKSRCSGAGERVLLLKRTDAEFCEYDFNSYIKEEASLLDVGDWPTMEKSSWRVKRFHHYLYKKGYKCRLMDIYADKVLRPHLVKTGAEFVSRYKKVYTTRLHVAILSFLLGKEVVFFDNSYGKSSSFYDTWLHDADNIKFIR